MQCLIAFREVFIFLSPLKSLKPLLYCVLTSLSVYFCFLLIFLRKRKNVPRLKIILTSIAVLVCILYRFSKPQNRLKSCFTCQYFTHDTIEITNEVNTSYFQSELSFFAISKFRFKNCISFYPLLLLLSNDISLNPGPFSDPQLFKQEEWQAFSNRGLYLIHLKINSLLPKIDELRDIAKRTNAAVIGISEPKFDSSSVKWGHLGHFHPTPINTISPTKPMASSRTL